MPPLERNADLMLAVLARYPAGLTRHQLGEETGLSRPTVRALLRHLHARGLVRIASTAGDPAEGGRPAQRVALAAPPGRVLGLDIGHGHLRAAAADGAGRVLVREPPSRPCDIDRVGPAALKTAVDLLDEALVSSNGLPEDVRAVGVGLPAPVASGVLAWSEYLPGWAGIDVGGELRELLSRRWAREVTVPIIIENDANIGALGEGLHGGAQGVSDYLYVKLSSGIGLGAVVGGRLVRGSTGLAGELGHISVPAIAERAIRQRSQIMQPHKVCGRCGKPDCLENLASCTAIGAQLVETTMELSDPRARYQAPVDVAGVISNARDHLVEHPLCRQVILDAAMRIGHTLAELVRIFDPSLILLGGLLADAGEVLRGPVLEAVQRAALPPAAVRVELVPPERVLRSEVEGALAIALEAASRR